MKTIVVIFLPLLLAGCTASNPQPAVIYRYVPQPAMAELVREGPNGQTPLVALVWVRREEASEGHPPAIHIHLRFENRGTVAVRFDPASLQLETGSLRPFPPPRVDPPHVIELAPGQTPEIDALFPFTGVASDPSLNADHLRLRWQVQVQGQKVPQDATFQRVALPPPPPAWAGP